MHLNNDKPLYSLTVGEFKELNRQIYAEMQSNQVQVNSNSQNEILTIDEASVVVNLAKPTIYSLTSKFKIPFFKKNKKLYFKRSQLLEWISEGFNPTDAQLIKEAKETSLGKGGKK